MAHEESLEQRPVELGQETTALVEITGGLEEGELVVLDPPSDSSNVESFRNSADQAYRTHTHEPRPWLRPSTDSVPTAERIPVAIV